jgi:hypothetical protein
MNCILLFIIISSIPVINSSYNPIPIGSVIVSTTHTISVLQPKEYGGTDKSTIIFTARKNMAIIYTIFEPRLRDLYILFTNTTNNKVYICQLISVEKIDSLIYQLPLSFNISNINKLTSFSSDVRNKRAFLTDQFGNVTMFSMSGTMKTILSIPSTITNPVRSVKYNQILNRLFIITDSTVDSCINLDQNNLQCCQALPKTYQLRSIAFDPLTSNSFAYVIDEQTGIYQVILNSTGCPITLRPMDTIGTYHNIHLDIFLDLYFCSGNTDNSNHKSTLIIGSYTQTRRAIPFDASIVALHISYPNMKSTINNEETCFHGIKYHDYRIAVILAAIFGTIMGLFMCFNALFCMDFFMTKRIIRDLKKQIPNNLFEDRWNKLVQEKYAKLAFERIFYLYIIIHIISILILIVQRKKNDPLPKRKSSAGVKKISTNDNVQSASNGEVLPISNPIPKISAYLRHKSESYISRCRSDDDNRLSSQNNTNGIKEEVQKQSREDISRQDLLKNERELL